MPKPRSILLMDDDTVFRTDLARYLESNGYEVTSCDTATEAKAHLEDRAFDLVISDLFVRSEDQLVPDGGVSLLGWMQSRHKIPKIAITGMSDGRGTEFLENMRALGADVCLQKPLSKENLLRHIKALLAAAEAKA